MRCAVLGEGTPTSCQGASNRGEADKVFIFRRFIGDQGRKRAMLVTMTHPSRREHGAVGLLTKLMSLHDGDNQVPGTT